MAHEDHKDSKRLPIEETLDKPDPFPLQERGNQLRPASSQLVPGWVPEDSPTWTVYAHSFLDKIIQLIVNVSKTAVVTCILAAAMEIPKIFLIPKNKTREREEMKTKVEEIENARLKEIDRHKRMLEEQIRKARGNLFTISHKESMEWEMNLITMERLVFRCGAEIASLKKLADRLESGARTTISWIVVQLTTGLVVIVVLCHWVYVKEDVETGPFVKAITAVFLLGVATHCIRSVQVFFDSCTLASECEEVKYELEKPIMACLMYNHVVENELPEKKKKLHVVDHEIPKCKSD